MIDLSLFKWINGFGTKSDFVDMVAWLITDYDRVIFWTLFGLYFLFHRLEPVRMRKAILLSVTAGLLALGIAAILGEMIYRPRPFEVLSIDDAQLLMPQGGDSSFLSEIATISVAFAAGMWRAPGKTTRWVFAFLSVLMSVNQVFVGFHWPSDILASAILGVLVTYVVFRWSPFRE